MSVSQSRAQRILPLAYDLASQRGVVSVWGITLKNRVYGIRMSLTEGRLPGLPSKIQGVPIWYDRRERPRQASSSF